VRAGLAVVDAVRRVPSPELLQHALVGTECSNPARSSIEPTAIGRGFAQQTDRPFGEGRTESSNPACSTSESAANSVEVQASAGKEPRGAL
jgi:hypothetical protein